MDRPWFTDKNFTALEIRKDKSLADHTLVRSVSITDRGYIRKLADRIGQIPPDGHMMKSFSEEAEYVKLIFFSGDSRQVIHVIQKRFQTPSTGFNAYNDYEKELHAEIDSLLFPAIDRIIPKVEGLLLDFGNFSLCYKGSRLEDLAPVSLSFQFAEFTFEGEKGQTQLIEISAGQLPPQPFVIDAIGLTLLTFHSKEGRRLYPDFFQLVAALPGR